MSDETLVAIQNLASRLILYVLLAASGVIAAHTASLVEQALWITVGIVVTRWILIDTLAYVLRLPK